MRGMFFGTLLTFGIFNFKLVNNWDLSKINDKNEMIFDYKENLYNSNYNILRIFSGMESLAY